MWHYQATPGDSWDYDAISPLVTADVTIRGEKKHVIIQPSKNGFLYVHEAATGKLISADAFTGVTWASGVDMKTGRPIEVPGARYETEPFNIGPGAPGGHTWHPNAFSPDTGLIYIPTWENYSAMAPQVRPTDGTLPPLVAFGGRIDRATLKPHNKQANDGWLQAWDPVARKVVWETPKGPRATSGAMATGGNLVFMGNSGGNELAAYNAKTGTKLWNFDALTAVYAAPITYELDGVQYIAASVGGAAAGDYFAPTLRAHAGVQGRRHREAAAERRLTRRAQLNPPALTASADVVERGGKVYAEHCSVCHGVNATQQRSTFPNLTVTPFLHSQEAFNQVVLQGREMLGMPAFVEDAAGGGLVGDARVSRVTRERREEQSAARRAGTGWCGRGAGRALQHRVSRPQRRTCTSSRPHLARRSSSSRCNKAGYSALFVDRATDAAGFLDGAPVLVVFLDAVAGIPSRHCAANRRELLAIATADLVSQHTTDDRPHRGADHLILVLRFRNALDHFVPGILRGPPFWEAWPLPAGSTSNRRRERRLPSVLEGKFWYSWSLLR